VNDELYDALLTTRAMRRFTDEPVADSTIEACLRAAVQAPSGGNIQPYQFVVVTEPEVKARLGEIYLRAWERYSPAVAAVTPPAKDDEARQRHERNMKASDDRSACAIPDRYEVVAMLPVGHPKGRWGVAPRRPAPALTNWNRFGERRL